MRAFQSPRRPAQHFFAPITGYNLARARLGQVTTVELPASPDRLTADGVEYLRIDEGTKATRHRMLIAGATGSVAGFEAAWLFPGV